jgi:hypothetical protein
MFMRHFLAFILLLPLSHAGFASNLDCQTHKCTAVIDAGSTKSYLHLYQYDLDDTNTPIHVEEKWSKKVMPGLATLDAQQVPAYLDELFSTLNQTKLPVYLYATAGMRLLSADSQDKLYNAVNRWFDQHQDYTLKAAKTITGAQEGVYGWVAANYQSGHLLSHDKLAVMDMGGASVQVVFPAYDVTGIAPENLKTIQLYGQSIILFVHSFLGLGQTEVIHQLLDEPGCYPEGYPLPNQAPATGDAPACLQKTNLLLQVHDVAQTIQPAALRNPMHHWFVMGGLSSLAKTFPFHFEHEIMTPQALISEGIPAFCHTSWDELSTKYPNDPYLATSCLASAYFYGLLVNGYGLNPEEAIQYSSGSSTDGWTIGVVILQ